MTHGGLVIEDDADRYEIFKQTLIDHYTHVNYNVLQCNYNVRFPDSANKPTSSNLYDSNTMQITQRGMATKIHDKCLSYNQYIPN